MSRSALQDWVMGLSVMQQSVLIAGVRGPDGIRKEHISKLLLRWYRRCVLVSAIDGCVLSTPWARGGGSFTGPSIDGPPASDWQSVMDLVVGQYLRCADEMPHHFQLHFMHAAEILGYKHPDLDIRGWWLRTYLRMVHDMHLWPESASEMDQRLGDTFDGWAARNEEAARA